MQISSIEGPLALRNNPPTTLAELFSRPDRWNKGNDARDRNGQPVNVRAESAKDWCIHGGLQLIYGEDNPEKWRDVQGKLIAYIREHYPEFKEIDSLTEWNDSDSIRFKDIRRVCLGAGV
jgi:hypothetical protein